MRSYTITCNNSNVILEIFLCLELSSNNKKELLKNIKQAFRKCSPFIIEKVTVLIFSTDDKFVIRKMNGIAGFSNMKNLIILNIHPTKGWQKALRETFIHEIAHVLTPKYHSKIITLRDYLVFDGLAEHFREHFLGGRKAVWVKSISEKQAILIFNKIKKYLDSKSDDLYRKLFFGTGKYPLWAGYAIGYYVVEKYLKKQGKLNWKSLFRTPTRTIIKGFYNKN
ncbi:MAG: DUF2268 domain-containing protein [Nanoarchaeota archaeon]|nr:DUF2268 domain-containing protein [Nanoarchaeota archaeon]MBU1321303.1 DUF2268 domain-containing protein [Nanoarchaeota archaeon]MBU1597294.1 DUF2268 domain-containing protein [Nanoarchaeota archaeon]MBU2441591.1 DUF2268 domain-containing protein [Nanoarchaeota archaeon]